MELSDAQTFLEKRFGIDGDDVEYVDEGAWSRCFGFMLNGSEMVIRFGRHLDDFQRDRIAARFAARFARPAGHRDRRGVRSLVLRIDAGPRHTIGATRRGALG